MRVPGVIEPKDWWQPFLAETQVHSPFFKRADATISYAAWGQRLSWALSLVPQKTQTPFVFIWSEEPEEMWALIQLAWLSERVPVLLHHRLTEAQLPDYWDTFPDAPLWCSGAGPKHQQKVNFAFGDLWHSKGAGLCAEQVKRAAPQEPYLVVFTSGSSGKPKAVVHSQQSLFAAAQASNGFYQATAQDVSALNLGVAHIGGLMVIIRSILAAGVVQLNEPGVLTPASFCSLVPTQLYRFLKDPTSVAVLRQHRAVLVGGAFCPLGLVAEALEASIPLSLSYGLSEAAAHVAACLPGHVDNLTGEATVAEGREVAVSPNGQILLRGAGLALGYWRDGTLVDLPRNEAGWYVTEDLGVVTAAGKMKLSGRNDDVIIVGAEKIDPARLEQELAALCGPWFYNAIGVNQAEWGERVALVFWSREAPQIATLAEAIFARLSGLEAVRKMYWVRVNDLPVKVTRKLSRMALKGQVAGTTVAEWQQGRWLTIDPVA